jgi:tetratricopeptide (TPR) repeat protein
MFALFSRENAILFPGYLFVALICYKEKNFKRTLIIIVPLLLIIKWFFFIRHAILGGGMLGFINKNIYSIDSVLIFLKILLKYLILVVAPFDVLFYRRIDFAQSFIQNFALIMFWILIFGFTLKKIRKNKNIIFAIGWFLVGALPTYSLMWSRAEVGAVMQDSWIYLSSIGLFFIIAQGLEFLRKRSFLLFNVIFLVLVLFFSLVSYNYTNVWKNTKTYCKYWNKVMPNNYFALRELGRYYRNDNQLVKAINMFEQALVELFKGPRIHMTRAASIYAELGDVLYKDGNEKKAEYNFEQALKYDKNNALANKFKGFFAANKGEFTSAEEFLKKSLEGKFYDAETHYLLACVQKAKGQLDMAQESLNIAVSIDPEKVKKLKNSSKNN